MNTEPQGDGPSVPEFPIAAEDVLDRARTVARRIEEQVSRVIASRDPSEPDEPDAANEAENEPKSE
jgi:hypothetical protein